MAKGPYRQIPTGLDALAFVTWRIGARPTGHPPHFWASLSVDPAARYRLATIRATMILARPSGCSGNSSSNSGDSLKLARNPRLTVGSYGSIVQLSPSAPMISLSRSREWVAAVPMPVVGPSSKKP